MWIMRIQIVVGDNRTIFKNLAKRLGEIETRKRIETIETTAVLKSAKMLILFTNPSAQAGYDTRSIFKRSLTGFNSEFSFS